MQQEWIVMARKTILLQQDGGKGSIYSNEVYYGIGNEEISFDLEDYNKYKLNTPQGGTAYGGYYYYIISEKQGNTYTKTRILIYDLGLDSLDRYKEEGKKSTTLKLMTYIDLEHAYNGQEPEDPSFDSKGNLWFMDCKRNLYKTDFNANEYGLNKNSNSIITN